MGLEIIGQSAVRRSGQGNTLRVVLPRSYACVQKTKGMFGLQVSEDMVRILFVPLFLPLVRFSLPWLPLNCYYVACLEDRKIARIRGLVSILEAGDVAS